MVDQPVNREPCCHTQLSLPQRIDAVSASLQERPPSVCQCQGKNVIEKADYGVCCHFFLSRPFTNQHPECGGCSAGHFCNGAGCGLCGD